MGNKIIIKYDNEKIAELDTDTPSLDDLVNFITAKQDMDVSLIKCECASEGFDSTFFEQAMKEAITEELECLKLDKGSYEEANKAFSKNN